MGKIWFETTVRLTKIQDNGSPKDVSEKYLFSAITPSEAESFAIQEIAPCSEGDFSVKSVVEQKYAEYIKDNSDDECRFYSATIEFLTLDEKTGKEKKTAHRILVQAPDLSAALYRIHEMMKGSMMEYAVTKIEQTKLVDVYDKE